MYNDQSGVPEAAGSRAGESPLESWKGIGAYLRKDITTVRRWEREEGLPVHRHSHNSRSSVYAYASEIDAWRASRNVVAELPVLPLWRSLLAPPHLLSFAVTILLCLIMVGNGLRPSIASAQTSGIMTKQVWAGPEVNTYGAPSPDGRFLTYIDWSTPALALHDLVTGETRRIMNGSWADPPEFPSGPSRFSPDGRQVISTWFNKKEFQDLRIVPVNAGPTGGTPRVLFSNEEVPHPYPAEWSPDGKSILTTFWKKDRTTQIALVTVADGSTRILKSLDWRSPGLMGFSPDGRYIAYDFPPKEDAPERDIFVLAADGSRETLLIQHPADDRLLGWTADGTHILFSSDRTGTPSAWLIEVSAGRPNGQPVLVKRDIGRIQPMGFTRSGSLYYGLSAGIRDIYLATIDPVTGKILEQPQLAMQRFLGANRAPEWSPDGENMAYFVNQSNTGRQPASLTIRSLKTGRERELISIPRTNLNIRPRWSPDGRWLLVHSVDGKGDRGLLRVNAQTGASTQLLRGGPRWGIWTADSKSILYVREDDQNGIIRSLELDTGADKELFRPEESTFVNNLALAPDGRRLAFGLSTISQIIGQVLMVMPLDGGKPRELLGVRGVGPQFAGLDWARDGNHLIFARAGQMWRIPAGGGEPQALGVKTQAGSATLAVHPDGRRIAFTAGEPKEEIWVMENFLPQGDAAK